MINAILFSVLNIILLFFAVRFMILFYKALKKYVSSPEKRQEREIIRKSLGETLKEHRMKNNMTQEFVAEHLNVSRQTVSKWENAQAEPSTSNLIAISKLYGVDAAELLRGISGSED